MYNTLAGLVAQSVTCLATDMSLTADPGGRDFDPGPVPYFGGDWSSTVILLLSTESFNKFCVSMCTKYWLTSCSSLPRKKCG